MATADKLTYLNTTKGKIKDVANMTGAGIDNNTTFRNYAQSLYDGYINVLKDRNTLLDNMNIGTSTGTITDSANLPIYEDKMSKLSTQEGTPTPSSPVEVKTVKGYRNLYDFVNGNYTNGNNATSSRTNGEYTVNSANAYSCVRFYQSNLQLKPNTKYTFRAKIVSTTASEGSSVYASPEMNSQGSNLYGNKATAGNISYVTFTTPATFDNNSLLGIYPREASATTVFTDIMLIEGELKPYVPYGTNWVYKTITDGTNSKIITMPLNDNEIVGKGNYKDEYIIDKNGHCWLNKKIKKAYLGVDILFSSTTGGFYSQSVNDYATSNNTPLCNWYKGILNVAAIGGVSNNEIAFNQSSSPYPRLYLKDSNYSSATTLNSDLSTNGVYMYYVLATEQLIDLNYNVDLTLYDGINNISNSEDMDMAIKYVKNVYE